MLALDAKTLRKLRKDLVPGDISRIANELGVASQLVSMVLRGKRNNDNIIEVAMEYQVRNLRKKASIVNSIFNPKINLYEHTNIS
jgi:predicted transcriptional regulator